jgi:ABC-2 type transport system ATP-binding protein
MTLSPILQVSDLYKSFGQVQAVRGISFEVPTGICLGLLGHNGAGKTTTVEILEGITRADSGTILYKGMPLDDLLRREAGIMFQHTALQEFITVRETLQMFSHLYPEPLPLERLINDFKLEDLLNRETKKLSGGQRQRLLLAIALINDPDIVFLDEPTTGLDPHARRHFWSLIQSIKAQGKTIVLTTHYMEEAYALCDQIIIMNDGNIIARGTPDALLKEHFNDVVLTLPWEQLPESLHDTLQIFRNREMAEILTADVDATIHMLHGAGISLRDLRVRERTLEDLFLTLTPDHAA